MAKVLVTGANGGVGSAVVARIDRDGRHLAVRAVRSLAQAPGRDGRTVEIGDLDMPVDWTAALRGVAIVVHTAARVHRMMDRDPDSAAAYHRVNTEATLGLARQAAVAGVSRLIFVSTIKVLGERSEPGAPFRADDSHEPVDDYAKSKAAAERGLLEVARASRMEVTIVRPPLVYGSALRGNFRRLVESLERGIPLPLGGIDNRRSLVSIDNLVDLLNVCLEHPGAANEAFLVSDAEDLSTTDLVRRLAVAMGRPPRLFTIPGVIVRATAALVGRDASAKRLYESLQVDIAKNRHLLGWSPPFGVDESLERVARSRVEQPRA